MTCAGCDDCPTNSWHLHVTVLPHKSWTIGDMAKAIEKDTHRQDARFHRITNHFRDPGKRPYVELIPTLHLRDVDEAKATWELHLLAHRLNNNGWRVRRMKLEADARLVPPGRALYYEAHIKGCEFSTHPMSMNSKGEKIFTVRRQGLEEVLFEVGPLGTKVEACTLDTNPSLDSEWISQ